ncbi:MAG: hypothetical protein AMJ95_01080 [Omnitrophica WOR_2 bacterium SM23_72]|nr:MAG: hypothetical protein AMJ95_01080 [Omnitrophica WOR_2 bacterium SM23_72]
MNKSDIKLKLIYPPIWSKAREVFLPYGLGILTSFLRKNDYSVELIDLNIKLIDSINNDTSNINAYDVKNFCDRERNKKGFSGIEDKENNLLAERLLSLLNLKDYNLVGIGVNSYNEILSALLLAQKIKQKYKIPIIMGGSYITLFGDLFFDKYDFIDYIIVGEGELPLLFFLDYLCGKEKFSNIPSLGYKVNNKAVINQRAYYDINNQSVPDFTDLSLELYVKNMRYPQQELTMPYQTSRGCTYRCSFCNHPRLESWETKNYDKVIKDILYLKEKYNLSFFKFEDPDINVSYNHINNLCDYLIKHNVNISWLARARVDNADRVLLQKMKQAGCQRIAWGIESGSDKILKSIHKGTTVEQGAKTLKIAYNTGIKNVIFILVGFPHETKKEVRETLLFLKRNKKFIYHIELYYLHLTYGCPIYNHPDDYRIRLKGQKFYYVFSYQFDEIGGINVKDKEDFVNKSFVRIKDYNYRYIESKRYKFPMNVLYKLLGQRIDFVKTFFLK